MLFTYQDYIQDLRHNPQKREVIANYETHVGQIGQQDLLAEQWYVELVKPYSAVSSYVVPEELLEDFDWGLLAQLGASSLSSEIGFERVGEELHLIIRVENEGTVVVKRLQDLWGFQILRMYEIWIEENINLCTLCHEFTEERFLIHANKVKNLKTWNHRIAV